MTWESLSLFQLFAWCDMDSVHAALVIQIVSHQLSRAVAGGGRGRFNLNAFIII